MEAREDTGKLPPGQRRRPCLHRAPISASVDGFVSVVLRSRPASTGRLRRAPIPPSVDGRASVVLRSPPASTAPSPSCSQRAQRRRARLRRAPILASVDGRASVVLPSHPASTASPPSCSDPTQRRRRPAAPPSCSDPGGRRRPRLRRAPILAVVDGRGSVVLRGTPSVDGFASVVLRSRPASTASSPSCSHPTQRRRPRHRRAPIPPNVDGPVTGVRPTHPAGSPRRRRRRSRLCLAPLSAVLDPAHRRWTTIFIPLLVPSVMRGARSTRCPGARVNRSRCAVVARMSLASMLAKLLPTHARGPAPKGA